MLAGGIIGRSIDRTECSLPSYAALKLPLDFLRAALFNRISAAARAQPCEDEQERRAFHLLILESRRCKASVVAAAVSTAELLAIR